MGRIPWTEDALGQAGKECQAEHFGLKERGRAEQNMRQDLVQAMEMRVENVDNENYVIGLRKQKICRDVEMMKTGPQENKNKKLEP